MAFNHYAKMKKILNAHGDNWAVVRINKPTSATNFKGEKRHFDHYYRVIDTASGQPIKYCKFQQLDRFARVIGTPLDVLPVLDDESLARP